MFNVKTIRRLKYLFKNNKTAQRKSPTKFNLPKYLIMFLFVPAISCTQDTISKIGLPVPPYDSYASIFHSPVLYFLYILFLVALLLFSVQPIAKFYKIQTCSLIAITNCFLMMHVFSILRFSLLGWLTIIISSLSGIALGALSFTSDEIRELALLPPIGYIIGYWIVAVFGFQNFFVAITIVGGAIFGSFFLKLLFDHQKIVYFGRGVCIGFLTLVTLDIIIIPLCIIQSIHKAKIGILPFIPLIFSLIWGCLLILGVYYEFNKTQVSSDIENRNLSPADKAQGIGVQPDDKEYKKKVEPAASMV